MLRVGSTTLRRTIVSVPAGDRDVVLVDACRTPFQVNVVASVQRFFVCFACVWFFVRLLFADERSHVLHRANETGERNRLQGFASMATGTHGVARSR